MMGPHTVLVLSLYLGSYQATSSFGNFECHTGHLYIWLACACCCWKTKFGYWRPKMSSDYGGRSCRSVLVYMWWSMFPWFPWTPQGTLVVQTLCNLTIWGLFCPCYLIAKQAGVSFQHQVTVLPQCLKCVTQTSYREIIMSWFLSSPQP